MKRSALVLASLLAICGIAATSSGAGAADATTEQSGLGFQGMGIRIGVVDPEDASSTVVFGAHVDAGQIVPHLHLVPNLEYWSVGVAGYDTSDLGFGLDANLDFPLQGSTVTPYAGAGLGLHFFSFDVPVGFAADDSKTKLGINIQGGIREQFMPNLSGFGEIRYSFIEDFNQLKLLGGFTYHFVY